MRTNEGYSSRIAPKKRQFLVNYILHEPTFCPYRIQKTSHRFPLARTFPSVQYSIKLKWWIHCSSNLLLFRRWTTKLLIICICAEVVLRPAKSTDWVFSHFEATTEWQHVWTGFRQKRGLERGQLQNNCLLFVWQHQGNFIQRVITLRYQHKMYIFNRLDEIASKINSDKD